MTKVICTRDGTEAGEYRAIIASEGRYHRIRYHVGGSYDDWSGKHSRFVDVRAIDGKPVRCKMLRAHVMQALGHREGA